MKKISKEQLLPEGSLKNYLIPRFDTEAKNASAALDKIYSQKKTHNKLEKLH